MLIKWVSIFSIPKWVGYGKYYQHDPGLPGI